jgi:hypothetical protein
MSGPFVVSDSKGLKAGDRVPVLGRFPTENDAARFIDGLPEHETGRYNLDGPDREPRGWHFPLHGPLLRDGLTENRRLEDEGLL